MKSSPQAKSIADRLSKLAKTKKTIYQNIATAFLIERLLCRLVSNSTLKKKLVFKGGYVGLRIYNSQRYTVDLDALLIKSDVKKTLLKTAEAIEQDLGDGTWFRLDSQVNLKTQGEYGGVRQVFRAGIGDIPKNLKLTQVINFDLGIGDPITPAPVLVQTYELIGPNEISWQVYPIETIIAEKLHALVVRGGDSSRTKDIFDLYSHLKKADVAILKEAIDRCFKFRGTEVPKDLVQFLGNLDTTLLKRGWPGATSSIEGPPTFEKAYNHILNEIKKKVDQQRK